MTLYARICGGCNGQLLLPYMPRRPEDASACSKCHARRMKGFDPKPGDMVQHVDYQSGPFSDLLVRSRTGDELIAWPIGWPDEDEYVSKTGRRILWHIGELVPKSCYGR